MVSKQFDKIVELIMPFSLVDSL